MPICTTVGRKQHDPPRPHRGKERVMKEIDKIANALRAAYGDHEGSTWIDWKHADPDKQEAWRAIAKRAQELGAKAPA